MMRAERLTATALIQKDQGVKLEQVATCRRMTADERDLAEDRLTRKQVLRDWEAVRAALPEVRHFPDTLERLRRIANAESK